MEKYPLEKFQKVVFNVQDILFKKAPVSEAFKELSANVKIFLNFFLGYNNG